MSFSLYYIFVLSFSLLLLLSLSLPCPLFFSLLLLNLYLSLYIYISIFSLSPSLSSHPMLQVIYTTLPHGHFFSLPIFFFLSSYLSSSLSFSPLSPLSLFSLVSLFSLSLPLPPPYMTGDLHYTYR